MKLIFGKSLLWVFILVFSALMLNTVDTYAGEKERKQRKDRKDSVMRARNLSPHKASLWAILPGAGQIYNRKYWKISLVYVGFAVIGYIALDNRNMYLKYNDAYICSVQADEDPDFTCEDPLFLKYPNTSDLLQIKDLYRRNTELTVIVGALWYILTIVDATVDAHLSHWEVNDNLSVDIQPVLQPIMPSISMSARNSGYNGIKIAISF